MIINSYQLDKHGCVLKTVHTDALVLKHQGISTHSAVLIFVYCSVVFRDIAVIGNNDDRKKPFNFEKNIQLFKG